MKYRSPLSIVLLTTMTLGIYEMYWILSTSRAMQTRAIRTANPWLYIAYRAVWLVLILASIAGISFNVIVHRQNRGEISAECMTEAVNHSAGTLPGYGPPPVVSAECNRQFDDYEHIKNVNRLVMPIILLATVWAILSPISTIVTKGWFSAYCYGLEKLIGDAYSATQIALILMLMPFGTGIATLQQEINKNIAR